jgi:CheY-like chemotaxis protein
LSAAISAVELVPAMMATLGLELAREHLPDLIVLDLHLPDMPGEQLLRRLKADPATARIPVIVLTADATKRQRERLLGLGALITSPSRWMSSGFSTWSQRRSAGGPKHEPPATFPAARAAILRC